MVSYRTYPGQLPTSHAGIRAAVHPTRRHDQRHRARGQRAYLYDRTVPSLVLIPAYQVSELGMVTAGGKVVWGKYVSAVSWRWRWRRCRDPHQACGRSLTRALCRLKSPTTQKWTAASMLSCLCRHFLHSVDVCLCATFFFSSLTTTTMDLGLLAVFDSEPISRQDYSFVVLAALFHLLH